MTFQPPRAAAQVNHGLDLVRGVAAALVVLGHSRYFVLLGLKENASSAGLGRLLLAPTGFAQEAVSIFFLLSGFLVGGQLLRQTQRLSFRWRPFLAKRLSRLWTVLIPGLLLTSILDLVSTHLSYPQDGEAAADGDHGIAAAVCNALFLQRPHCAPYGSNTSLWSLAYEFWFYIFFAACTTLIACIRVKKRTQALIAMAIAVATILIFGVDLLRLLPAWLLGVGVAALVSRRRQPQSRLRPGVLVACGLLLFVALCLSNYLQLAESFRFIFVAALAAPMLFFITRYNPGQDSSLLKRFGRSGDWSYSCYVYHLPILKLLIAVALGAHVVNASFPFVYIYVLAVISYILTIPLWWFTERHTGIVRAWLLSALSRNQTSN